MPKEQPAPNLPVTKAATGDEPIPKGYYGLEVTWPITNRRFRALFPITWSNPPAQDEDEFVPAAA